MTAGYPAASGETIMVSAIGLGPTNPVVPTGTPAPPGVPTATPTNVMLNGQQPIPGGAAVLAPGQVGLYEITFTVPASPATGNPLLWVEVGAPNGYSPSNYLNLPVVLSLAPPVIDGLANNYSYIQPGLPNYGIAQGSIFDIFGSNLANVRTNQQSVPLSTSLQGVTVGITVNGTVTQAFLYYVTPNQIGAILPSATPVGDGIITVNNGVSSSSAPIHVVQSAFGILTMNNAGTGPASAFNVNFNQLGFTNALNPGDYFILWGTGVGPSPGAENVIQTPTDLTNIPFSIEVGGLPAQLVYHGRSLYPGLDQVIGIVPAGVSPGCWVSVVTRSGNIVSNFATLPVAASGRTCSEPTLGVTASQMQTLLSKNAFNIGMLDLQKQGNTQFAGTQSIEESDSATAAFLNVKAADFVSSVLGPSIGSCLVTASSNGSSPWGNLPSTPLDAGPAINIAGGSGTTAAISYQSNPVVYGLAAFGSDLFPSGLIPFQNSAGAYSGIIGGGNNQPMFIPESGGGQYTFANGTGGADVGSFQAGLTLASPLLAWPQRTTLNRSTMSLSGGLTVAWSNGNANSFVQISGRSAPPNSSPTIFVEFTCSVPAAAGQFTIPATVLLYLPPSVTSPDVDPSLTPLLQVSQLSLPQSFAAPNLDFDSVQSIVSITIVVYYQ